MRDYVPVSDRIDAFYRAHPEGSMQSEIVELTAERVTVKAYAYRTVDDPRPGIGHSSLEIPGKTSFTKGSEIENAETSAWGRAIAALGFEVKRGLASAEEVRNKQPERGARGGERPSGQAPSTPSGASAPASRSPEENALLDELMAVPGMSKARASLLADAVGVVKGERATADQLREMLSRAIQPLSGVFTAPADGEAEAARASVSPTTPHAEGNPDSSGSAAATDQPELSPAPAGPAPTFEDVLRVSGGVEVPPAPGSAAYRALPTGVERAAAKAYWEAQPEQLQVPS